MLTCDSAWVLINLICVIYNVMRGQIVSLSITCKLIQAACKDMQIFIYFLSAKFRKQTTKHRTSMDSATSASDRLILAISLTLWQLSYYLLTCDSAWVLIKLICVIYNVMRGQFVSLSITCKIIQAACKDMQTFI